jgi:molecular chaperone DnaJ
MPGPDYYEVLGIDRSADEAVIKSAYRSLAMKYHPDKNPGNTSAIEKMKEINEAYAVLSDPDKRRMYDTYGESGLKGYTREDIFRGVDFGSLFREFGLRDFSGFGDSLFDTFFGGRTATRRGRRRGADLRYDLSISLEEAAFGTQKTISLPVVEQCPACNGSGAEPGGLEKCDRCNGTGQIVRERRSGYSIIREISVCGKCGGSGQIVKKACKNCNGKGVIKRSKELSITIPSGSDTGYQIRIEGEGEKGDGGPGDLYVILNVEKHPVFERHEYDIYTQQEVDFTLAALGGQISVPGLKGSLPLDIPEGTQSGAVLRIVNKGIPHLDGYGRGDEYVILKVMTPTNLSEQEKDLLSQFRGLRGRKPARKRRWWQFFLPRKQ